MFPSSISPYRRLVVGALVLLSITCAPPDGEPRDSRAVWQHGCSVVLRDHECVLDKTRAMSLWVEGESQAGLSVEIDGREQAFAVRPTDGGARIELEVPEGARELRLEGADVHFALRIVTLPHQGELDALRALRRKGDRAALDEAARALLAHGSDAERALTLGVLARAKLDTGDTEAAVGALERSMAEAANAGVYSAASSDGLARVYTLCAKLRRFDEAALVFSEIEGWLGDLPGRRTEARIEQAACERATGNLRAALPLLRDAEQTARRIGYTRMDLYAGQARARILQTLGRGDEALALFDELEPLARDGGCGELFYVHNRSWVELLQAERKLRDVPHALLERARRLSAPDGGCPDAQAHLNSTINSVLAGVHEGKLAAAQQQLGALRAQQSGSWPEADAWLLELDGRMALAHDDARSALRAYEELTQRAATAMLPGFSFQGALGRGRALERLGDLAAAARAFQDAEDDLDREARLIPLGEGRDTFASEREQSAMALVDVLDRLGRSDAALAAARVARTRALRALAHADGVARLQGAERESWSVAVAEVQRLREQLSAESGRAWQLPRGDLPAFERAQLGLRERLSAALDRALSLLGQSDASLPAIVDGEVVLLFFPLPSGVVGFVSDGRETKSHRFASAPEGAADWLAPFVPELLGARVVRVLPHGVTREIDFHALDVLGKPLLAHVPVVYGLDVSAARSASAGAGALVVADPRADLPLSRGEGDHSAARLAQWHAVERLTGREATRDELLRALEAREVLHFAGHGKLEGRGGWLSALLLAKGERLEIGDILTARAVPAYVVLSGCETGRAAGSASVATLGLAQAFTLSGSRAVIATSRAVRDEAAAAFTRALYADDAAPRFDAAQFRRAALAFRDVHPDDWSSFRLLVP